MPNIRAIDMLFLNDLFAMGGGYVLNFSDRTARTTGPLPKDSYRYTDCLRGLDAIIASVTSRYRSIDLVSWGANTWRALGKRVTRDGKQKGIMNQARERGGKVLKFNSAGDQLPYLPMAHPSFDTNFRQDFHLGHVFEGFGAMGLGKPWERKLSP